MSSELITKLEAILQKTEMPDRHTYFQLQKFVIGKEYTVQGQLWAIIRELKARYDGFGALQMEIEDLEDHLESIDIRIERACCKLPNDELEGREQAIQLRRLNRKKKATEASRIKLQSKLRYLLEEIDYFVTAFEKLSLTQQIKPLDDIKSQREYWNEKYLEELNLRLLLHSHIDTELVRGIMSLDDDAPVKQQMTQIMTNVQKIQIAERDRQRAELAQKTSTKHIKND